LRPGNAKRHEKTLCYNRQHCNAIGHARRAFLERDMLFVKGRQTGSTNRTADRESQAGPGRAGKHEARKPLHAIQCLRIARKPMQSFAAKEAWPLLLGQLYPKGQERHRVLPQGRTACDTREAEKLRTNEAACRSLDRAGNRTIQPAAHRRSAINPLENSALSSSVESIRKDSALSSSKCNATHYNCITYWQFATGLRNGSVAC